MAISDHWVMAIDWCYGGAILRALCCGGAIKLTDFPSLFPG